MTIRITFHEKNVCLFGKLETTSGTHITPAASDALQCSTLTAEPVHETTEISFLGDALSRESFTFQKDVTAEIKAETVPTVLGALVNTTTVANAPRSNFFQACGANITVLAAAKYGYAQYGVIMDNVTSSDDTISLDYRMASPDDLTNDKLFEFTRCQGMVDLDIKTGEYPKLTFNFKGNVELTSPTASPKVEAVFGTQSIMMAPSIREATLVTATAAPVVPIQSITKVATAATAIAYNHGLTTADSVYISGITGADGALYNGQFTVTVVDANTFTYTMAGTPTADATGRGIVENTPDAKNICFDGIMATNFFGFDYQRLLTSCEAGWSKGPIATDVTMNILEEQVGMISFNPDANLEKYFAVKVKWGTGAGKYLTLKWNKLQCVTAKEGKIGSRKSRDTSFKNTGNSYIIYE